MHPFHAIDAGRDLRYVDRAAKIELTDRGLGGTARPWRRRTPE